MGKFGVKTAPVNVQAPMRSTGEILPTHEGGVGYARDAKSELFLLAVSNMVKEETFYETGASRDQRFAELVKAVADADPAWIAGFVPYLRNTMQMRSASVVAAAEYVAAGGPHGRQVVASALSRADEPAEILAYWYQTHGRRTPKPLKRGVADATLRLYTERAVLKYDTGKRAWRMGDVIDLTHPKPSTPWQSDLFRLLLDRRHGYGNEPPETLPVLRKAAVLDQVPQEERRGWLGRTQELADAGITWERLSAWLGGPMDAAAWEAVIPSMGYMALLRNLRNFEEAGVSGDVLRAVADRLADPEQVKISRQFPIRFMSAWKATGSMTFGPALEAACEASVANIPPLRGSTLILVDCSGSMADYQSGRSQVQRWEVAALFGCAVAKASEKADLFAYSNNAAAMRPGPSILRAAGEFMGWQGAGGGTRTFDVLRHLYAAQDRVIILTDEQAFYSDAGCSDIPLIYTFNLAGYRPGHLPSGEHGRYTFGGLTDAGFRMLGAIENQRDVGWPWDAP